MVRIMNADVFICNSRQDNVFRCPAYLCRIQTRATLFYDECSVAKLDIPAEVWMFSKTTIRSSSVYISIMLWS
jgi:hypothetical protein